MANYAKDITKYIHGIRDSCLERKLSHWPRHQVEEVVRKAMDLGQVLANRPGWIVANLKCMFSQHDVAQHSDTHTQGHAQHIPMPPIQGNTCVQGRTNATQGGKQSKDMQSQLPLVPPARPRADRVRFLKADLRPRVQCNRGPIGI